MGATFRRRSPDGRPALGALAAGCILALAITAQADPIARIGVTVIHAKKSPPFLHDKVQPLWDTLRKTFGDRFAHYDLMSVVEREVAKGGRVEVPMPDGGLFMVEYRGLSKDSRFLKLSIVHDDLKSRVRLHDGGLLFQAGKRWKGGVLIIGVRASTGSLSR